MSATTTGRNSHIDKGGQGCHRRRRNRSSSATVFASAWVPSGLVAPTAATKRGKAKVLPSRHGDAKTWIRESWAEDRSYLCNSGRIQIPGRVMVDSDWKPPFNLDSASFSSCRFGRQIPNWLQSQKSISYLEISDAGLIDRIPDWFWNTFSNATVLDLSYNQISGELPLNLEFMSVTEFLLQSNRLTGSVPQLPRSIELLDISKNSLNGQLPSNFIVPYLQVALLFSNCITGIIPESICRWPQLRHLDLSNNQLTSGLPECGTKELKQQKPSNNISTTANSASSYSLQIRTLFLKNNSLSGGFPLFLKQCQNLTFLDLTQNKFSGKLPAWISEDTPSLVMLRLRSNFFSGHIPIEITRLFSLRILDLANNTFSGVIPQSLVNLKALIGTAVALDSTDNPFQEGYESEYMFLEMGMSNDSLLSLVVKGQVLDYRENAIYFMSIDLSCNSLAGQIPKEIGSLLGLINLNLSSNLLSGNIPYKMGNLQSLESLDLSNNQFSGEIPRGLSNLTSLSYLNLSYNNLSGRIPSGHQLDTLRTDDPASMYIGNPGLCGHPLPKLKKMCKEGAYWGTVAGVYVGMVYGVERVRGRSDWKNALIGGTLSGALISGASNNNKDKIIKDAITAGAVATAVEFINYLT
ncbi:Protein BRASSINOSTEROID INSENSITIVE 1 [Dichanthelium oligosanthes]|uniref:Protein BRASSINOSTEROID INSENSITIVE 1 n=1 Tax=Dichanthelium oligosanthes TaxID=888268 RepID=A0A1E5V039_9POAL|nr:Protein BRASSINOSTEROID INSENSITIVE 1 [Dichanthelium oligosanthes]